MPSARAWPPTSRCWPPPSRRPAPWKGSWRRLLASTRLLAEFGDDPTRYANPKARKNYAGTSPITKASGTRRAVLARVATNKRLRDALHLQAFAALTHSPGARAYYDEHRARGAGHNQALRAVRNRLVGILHGCLRHAAHYDEVTAWPRYQPQSQAAASTFEPWDV